MNRRSFLKALGLAPLLAALPALAKVTPLKPQLQRYTGSMLVVADITEGDVTINLPAPQRHPGQAYHVEAVGKASIPRHQLLSEYAPEYYHVIHLGESISYYSNGREWRVL